MVLQIFATPHDADEVTDRDQVDEACAIDHVLNHCRRLLFAETHLPARPKAYISRKTAEPSQHRALRRRIRRHEAKYNARKIAKADVILCQMIKVIIGEVEWNKALLKIRAMSTDELARKIR